MEDVQRQNHYYRNVRVSACVRSVYIGRNEAVDLIAQIDAIEVERCQLRRMDAQRVRQELAALVAVPISPVTQELLARMIQWEVANVQTSLSSR